ncbi:hypothetical protein [Halorubrum sp. AJ67]|uniref:hypothetical protein n=1 Tax=Halorubrum sp. AJ67 TaxID=1173487 RepID=UPI0003DD1691|nr:hypothetical protein [Halorubrum sp. AJ67]CDK38144.1 hypothetical protein BN903_343 [Halorubrum sp. AJ67]
MSDTNDTTEAEAAVGNARAFLSDFEDESLEVQHGAIEHAISELQNAKRALPDEN